MACSIVLNISVSNANAAQVENYTQYLPDGANLALMVQKLGHQPCNRLSRSADGATGQYAKVLTALAALLQLGPDFRFNTTLESPGTITDGVLRGNLIARFGGDPTLTRQQLRNMVATLRKAGLNKSRVM